MITVYTIQNESTIIVSNIVSNDRQLLNYVCYIKFKDKGSMMSNGKRYGKIVLEITVIDSPQMKYLFLEYHE